VNRFDRVRSLDVLRAIAVLLVIGHHSGYAGDGLPPPLDWVMAIWNRAGWMGVDLFFVLSGFLVSGLLFRERRIHGRIQVGYFLMRRGLKIYPAFYVYLVAVVAYYAIVRFPIPPATLLSEALFVQNYGSRFLVHTWSLAVEEHFYLLLALAFAAGAARVHERRFMVGLFSIVAVGALALRLVTYLTVPYTDDMRYYTHLRIDSLMAGVLIAYFFHLDPARLARLTRSRPTLMLLAALLIAPASAVSGAHPFMVTIGVTLLYVAFGAILILMVTGPRREARDGPLPPHRATSARRGPRLPPHRATSARRGPRLASGLAFVGRHSYSIYLWHLPVRVWLPWNAADASRPVEGAAQFVALVLVSLAVGVASSKIVELPVLHLRDRIFPSRSSTPIV
jgi:peptidoglycan/LPS O-acetylase OafA/YrhL